MDSERLALRSYLESGHMLHNRLYQLPLRALKLEHQPLETDSKLTPAEYSLQIKNITLSPIFCSE